MIEMLKSIIDEVQITGRGSGCGKIYTRLASTCDEIYRDRAGNIIGLVRGTKPKKKIMLQTHADSAGFMITEAEENGLIRFCKIGDVSLQSMLQTEAVTENDTHGIIVTTNSGAEKISEDCSDFALDIGENNREAALKRVRSGEFFIPAPHMIILGEKEHKFCGYPMDGRAGASVLLKCAERLAARRPENDINIVLTTGGARLAGTAAANIKPDEALLIGSDGDSKIGGGAVIIFRKGRFAADEMLTWRLKEAAERLGSSISTGVSGDGDSAGMRIQSEGAGTPTAEIDIPVRDIHTAGETVTEKDMEEALKLAEAFCRAK